MTVKIKITYWQHTTLFKSSNAPKPRKKQECGWLCGYWWLQVWNTTQIKLWGSIAEYLHEYTFWQDKWKKQPELNKPILTDKVLQ